MLTKSKIYRIFNKETGQYEGVYQRGNYDKYDFYSPDEARGSNCHGIYKDEEQYDIHEFTITEEKTYADKE